MAIPPGALVWREPMDPYDIVDYVVDCTAILDENETIASFTILPTSDSLLAGLIIGSDNPYKPSVESGKLVRIWLRIADAMQTDPMFSGNGVPVPMELTITTTSGPPRRKQRTLVVQVMQR